MAEKDLDIKVNFKFPGGNVQIERINGSFRSVDKTVSKIADNITKAHNELMKAGGEAIRFQQQIAQTRASTARLNAEASKLRAITAMSKHEWEKVRAESVKTKESIAKINLEAARFRNKVATAGVHAQKMKLAQAEVARETAKIKVEQERVREATMRQRVESEKIKVVQAGINAQARQYTMLGRQSAVQVAKIRQEMVNARLESKKINTSSLSFLANLGRIYVAYNAIRRVMMFVKQAFTLQKDAAEGIRASIASNASIITSTVRPVGTLANTYKIATDYATRLHNKFTDINKNTLATTVEMEVVNRELLKAGVLIDYNNEAQLKGFESLVNTIALFTAGMPDAMNQYRQETNAMLNGLKGRGREVSNFLNAVLGSSWADIIDKWREGGVLLEELGKILKGFNADTSNLNKLWITAYSSLRATISEILGQGFFPVFDVLIKKMGEFNGFLILHKDEYIAGIQAGWTKVLDIITTIVDVAKPLTTAGAGILSAAKFIIPSSPITAEEKKNIRIKQLRGKLNAPFESAYKSAQQTTAYKGLGGFAYKTRSINDPVLMKQYEENLKNNKFIDSEKYKGYEAELNKLLEIDKGYSVDPYSLLKGKNTPIKSGTVLSMPSYEGASISDLLYSDKQLGLTGYSEMMNRVIDKFKREQDKPAVGSTQITLPTYEGASISDLAVPSMKSLGLENTSTMIDRLIEKLQSMKEPIQTWGQIFKDTVKSVGNTMVYAADEFSSSWRSGLDSIMEKWSESKHTWHTIWNDIMEMTWLKFKETLAKMVAEIVIQMVVIEGIAAISERLFPGTGEVFKESVRQLGGLIPRQKSFTKVVSNVPSKAIGADELASDKLIYAHQGETIIPKEEAAFLRSGKLALVAAGNTGAETSSGLSAIASKLDSFVNRPIMNVFDFGEDKMIQFSRHLEIANYRRAEMRI